MKHILIAFAILLSAANAHAQTPFPDVPQNHWAADAIARLVEAGIIVGYPAKQTRTVSSEPQKVGKTISKGVKKSAGKTR